MRIPGLLKIILVDSQRIAFGIGSANLEKSKIWPVPRPEESGNVRAVSSLVDSRDAIPFDVWPAVNTFGLY